MNEVQTRIMYVLQNLGGTATTDEVRTLGFIPKRLDIIEMNLRNIAKTGKVELIGSKWKIVKDPKKVKELINAMQLNNRTVTDTQKVRAEKIPVTVGELEDAVDKMLKQNTPEAGCVVLDAISRLEKKLAGPDNGIHDFQLKYDVVMKLADLMEDSVAGVLKSIADDLAYLNSFTEETA